jgi:molybdenum cofactor cytidylyltransferase
MAQTLSAAILADIAQAFRIRPLADGESKRHLVRAVSQGKPDNPVILPRALYGAVMRLEGDVGARHIIEKSGLPMVDIELGAAAGLDVDTQEGVIAEGGIIKA